jgi:hypothetical protein
MHFAAHHRIHVLTSLEQVYYSKLSLVVERGISLFRNSLFNTSQFQVSGMRTWSYAFERPTEISHDKSCLESPETIGKVDASQPKSLRTTIAACCSVLGHPMS